MSSADVPLLEDELQTIYKQRDEVESKIRAIEAKERNRNKVITSGTKRVRDFGGSVVRDNKNAKNEDSESNKRPKLSSQVVVQHDRREDKEREREKDKDKERDNKDTKHRENNASAPKPKLTSAIVTGATRQSAQMQTIHQEDKVRNKKLFGALLLGTLQSFKKKDEQIKESTSAQKRKEMEEKIELKVKQEHETFTEQQKKKMQESKEKELAAREEIRKNQEEKEIKLLKAKWEQHRAQLGKFKRTETKPHIYYKEVEVDKSGKPQKDSKSNHEEKKEKTDKAEQDKEQSTDKDKDKEKDKENESMQDSQSQQENK